MKDKLKNRLVEVAFDSMEENKEDYLNNDKEYIKAAAGVEDLIEELEKELPGDKRNLIIKLHIELEKQIEKRDTLIYSLGLTQGAVMKLAESEIKKALGV